jgi:hypothetical protein
MALNMYVRSRIPFLGSFLTIVGVLLSIPGAFLGFRRLIAFWISFGVAGFIGPLLMKNDHVLASTDWAINLTHRYFMRLMLGMCIYTRSINHLIRR